MAKIRQWHAPDEHNTTSVFCPAKVIVFGPTDARALLFHPALQLSPPVKFVDEAARITPAGFCLHVQFEKYLSAQHAFHLQARRCTDLLQHRPAFPDQNSLLALPLTIN